MTTQDTQSKTENPKSEIEDPKPHTPTPKPDIQPDLAALQKELADQISDLVKNCGDPNKEPSGPRYTAKGSRCARSWDDAWVEKVEASEQRLERRICGARTLAGTPCELAPNHENGRCRFHGGFALTGGQERNRNAAIHGLYSRRLRVCDTSCPLWNECPCAGQDVESLSPVNRPTCPYEQTEYNSTLTDALDRVSRNPNHDGLDLHVAHNLALLQVMLNRAAVSMRNAPLVEESVASTDAYQMKSSKASPHLDAFTRISREYRQFAAMLKAPEPVEPDLNEFANNSNRAAADTELDPDNDTLLHPAAPFTGAQQAKRYLREAVKHAASGKDVAAMDAVTDAVWLQPRMNDDWADRVIAAYRPKGQTLPPQVVEKVIRHLLKTEPEEGGWSL